MNMMVVRVIRGMMGLSQRSSISNSRNRCTSRRDVIDRVRFSASLARYACLAIFQQTSSDVTSALLVHPLLAWMGAEADVMESRLYGALPM